jgi:glutamate racemase
MKKNDPIGVMDSGVGGLTVLHSLQKHFPHEHFLYLGDTARTPYGIRTRAEITSMVAEMTDWLASQNIKQLIVACNTITVLGTDVIRRGYPFHVIGMSRGARLALAATKNKRIGVFATDFTVSTRSHQEAIQALDSSVQVFSQGCTKLVPLIEAEQFASPQMADAIQEYVDILKKDQVDTVLLSCTHYPFLRQEIEQAFGPGVTVIDPADATAAAAQADLKKSNLEQLEGTGHSTICFTGHLERSRHLAAKMLDLSQCDFKEINLKN